MNRCELTGLLGAGLLASARSPRIALAASAPRVSITMDDLNPFGAAEAPHMDRLGL